MEQYKDYNREERNLCSHLFRLLHHDLEKGKQSTLAAFIRKSSAAIAEKLADSDYVKADIISEVALFRDAYKARSPRVNEMMDGICNALAQEMGINDFTTYSKLQAPLNEPWNTHPKQIHRKAEKESITLMGGNDAFYKEIQSIFNAKPDLCICIGNYLLVYEAKFTEGFKEEQMKRTKRIAAVWQKTLYKDLGFDSEPKALVLKLGGQRFKPHVNWQQVLELSKGVYSENDRSRQAFESAVELLNN
ncbi:MAG: hypothetical protein ACPGLV_16005 [Bacteroidia bacterium]